jgi:cyclophilin family peptidyl-prolyl cis-trans isomerase
MWNLESGMRILLGVLVSLAAQDGKADPAAPAEFKVRLETTKGDLVVRVVREWAPRGADRFHALVKSGAYDDTRFYRVLPKFIAQWGFCADPKVTAKWRDTPIKDDPVKKRNVRGTLSFAKGGPDTRTLNVFVNLKDNASLDKDGFAPFAEVVEGMEFADQLHSGHGSRPQQPKIAEQGNAYLDKEFKDLDRIKKASILE